MQRVVLDTSVIVAAFRSRSGASNILLELAFRGVYQIAATNAVFLEYEQVLQRETQRSFHGKTPREIDSFLVELASIILPVNVHFSWRPQLSDEDDEMVFESAANGYVNSIVTHNRKDFLPAATRFSIRVLSPADFLKEVQP